MTERVYGVIREGYAGEEIELPDILAPDALTAILYAVVEQHGRERLIPSARHPANLILLGQSEHIGRFWIVHPEGRRTWFIVSASATGNISIFNEGEYAPGQRPALDPPQGVMIDDQALIRACAVWAQSHRGDAANLTESDRLELTAFLEEYIRCAGAGGS